MSIDCHIHIFRTILKTVPNARHVPRYDATLDMLRPIAAAAGVTRFVIVQTSFLGTNNDYLLQEISRDPKNLRGVVILAPEASSTEIRDLSRQGIVGLRLNLFKTHLTESLSDAHLDMVSRCSEQGWSIGVHDDAVRLPFILDRLEERAPKLVIDHFGRPESFGGDLHNSEFRMILKRIKRLGASVKISAPYRSPGLGVPAAIELLESELGPDKLLWGSDWPWTQHESGQDYADWACGDGSTMSLAERVAQNAESFYGF